MIENEQKIKPEKITKPIQLLAAWLLGLILLDGSFLTAANFFAEGSKESLILVIAAVANVPIFLSAIFLLQTRFRPELQEDIYYSKYLDKKTNQIVKVNKIDKIDAELDALRNQIVTLQNSYLTSKMEEIQSANTKLDFLGKKWKIGVNDLLPNYQDIRERLRKEKIGVSDLFGSNSQEPTTPDLVVSFSGRVDFISKSRMLKLAYDLGFKRYDYYDENDEVIIDQHILLGSYGLGRIPINQELIDLLNSTSDAVDLMQYERKFIPYSDDNDEPF